MDGRHERKWESRMVGRRDESKTGVICTERQDFRRLIVDLTFTFDNIVMTWNVDNAVRVEVCIVHDRAWF